jgi:hypothetical protein
MQRHREPPRLLTLLQTRGQSTPPPRSHAPLARVAARPGRTRTHTHTHRTSATRCGNVRVCRRSDHSGGGTGSLPTKQACGKGVMGQMETLEEMLRRVRKTPYHVPSRSPTPSYPPQNAVRLCMLQLSRGGSYLTESRIAAACAQLEQHTSAIDRALTQEAVAPASSDYNKEAAAAVPATVTVRSEQPVRPHPHKRRCGVVHPSVLAHARWSCRVQAGAGGVQACYRQRERPATVAKVRTAERGVGRPQR